MRIGILRERAAGETRVAATPETAKKFIALGATVAVERGAGESAAIPDQAFADAGAELGSAEETVRDADIVVSVVVETMKQIEAQLMMRNYEGFIR